MKQHIFAGVFLIAFTFPAISAESNININQKAGLPATSEKPEAAPVSKTPEKVAEENAEPAEENNPNDNVTAEARTKHLARLEEYLNRITTIVADFTQVAPDGSLSSGKFYLKRPGKMRWEYDPPTPILMVANKDSVVFWDYELEQVSHIPVEDTLATFLARDEIRLNDPRISIDSVSVFPGVLRIILSQKDRQGQGSLTLEFADHPLQLRNMIVADAQGQFTTVSLNNARFGKKLDDSLFVFIDPRNRRK